MAKTPKPKHISGTTQKHEGDAQARRILAADQADRIPRKPGTSAVHPREQVGMDASKRESNGYYQKPRSRSRF